MVHLQGVLTLSWVLLAIVLVSSVPQSGALVNCWIFERWDLVGGPWITAGEKHETAGFFSLLLLCFLATASNFAVLYFYCVCPLPQAQRKRETEAWDPWIYKLK